MDPMIKNSFFTILIYWNDNRIHLGLTKKLIFFILFPPLLKVGWPAPLCCTMCVSCVQSSGYTGSTVWDPRTPGEDRGLLGWDREGLKQVGAIDRWPWHSSPRRTFETSSWPKLKSWLGNGLGCAWWWLVKLACFVGEKRPNCVRKSIYHHILDLTVELEY